MKVEEKKSWVKDIRRQERGKSRTMYASSLRRMPTTSPRALQKLRTSGTKSWNSNRGPARLGPKFRRGRETRQKAQLGQKQLLRSRNGRRGNGWQQDETLEQGKHHPRRAPTWMGTMMESTKHAHHGGRSKADV
jgi:hypothetical protein